ncbi:unnamed protein product [Gongylonema pulchrum]|uniref:7TM_GPCR_Srx domain-containing protein n=1 Tax=Gongylonema pulchrum TaxID=637853 RepID=A0A183EC94_9BILA|nr:unnamed protein product [Gongylonema pulchrum]
MRDKAYRRIDHQVAQLRLWGNALRKKYSLVVELNRGADLLLKRINFFTYVIGMLGAVGMFIVANFQFSVTVFCQESAVITVHLVAALTCFGSGCVYMLLQSFIAFYMYPLYNNRRIGFIRGAIALSAVLCFLTGLAFSDSRAVLRLNPDIWRYISVRFRSFRGWLVL